MTPPNFAKNAFGLGKKRSQELLVLLSDAKHKSIFIGYGSDFKEYVCQTSVLFYIYEHFTMTKLQPELSKNSLA